MWWLQVLRTNPVMEAFGNASWLDFGLVGSMGGHVFFVCQVFSKVAWGCCRFEKEPLYTWVLPEAIGNLLRILFDQDLNSKHAFSQKLWPLVPGKDCFQHLSTSFTPPKMCLRMHCGCHRYHQHASIIITEKHLPAFKAMTVRNNNSSRRTDVFFVAVGTFPRFPLDQADVLFLFVENRAEKKMLNHKFNRFWLISRIFQWIKVAQPQLPHFGHPVCMIALWIPLGLWNGWISIRKMAD